MPISSILSTVLAIVEIQSHRKSKKHRVPKPHTSVRKPLQQRKLKQARAFQPEKQG